MIEPNRKELLERLLHVSELMPDLRFGQLVGNLSFLSTGRGIEALWELDDDELIAAIRQFESDLLRREAASAA